MNDRGVIYAACGDGYLLEALHSAKTLRRYLPNVHVTLFTDQSVTDSLFDAVVPITFEPALRYYSKIEAIMNSPYERTVYLDCDTVVLGDFGDLFTGLELFDCGAAKNIHRGAVYGLERFGAAVPSLSSSTFAFRKSELMDRVFQSWSTEYRKVGLERPGHGDQEILTRAILGSGARYWVLSDEYNFHLGHIGQAYGRIRIGTVHAPRYKEIAEQLNRYEDLRAWVPGEDAVYVEQWTPRQDGSYDRNILRYSVRDQDAAAA